MKILYKFPCRMRKERMFATIDNIIAMSTTDEWTVQLTLDVDDSVLNSKEVLERIKSYGEKVIHYYGFSTGKINSCNRDLELSPPFDIIILMSDDMVFIEKGFDSFIIHDMQKYFPDLDGVLHYPDGSPAMDILITMSIMGRTYFDRFGFLYEPSFVSVYADNEFTAIAKKLGKYKFSDKQLFEHRHFIWGKAPIDDLYIRNENKELYAVDYQNFIKRKKKIFYLW